MVAPELYKGVKYWAVDRFQQKYIKYVSHLKRSTMASLVYGETGRYLLSITVYEHMIRFGACSVQFHVEKCSTYVNLAMSDLYEHGIVWSPWLDRVILISIKKI